MIILNIENWAEVPASFATPLIMMEVNGEALQLHAVYKKRYFLLQVTRESVSGTANHARIRIRYYKSRACV